MPGPGPYQEVSVVVEVVRPPAVARLYFWALQVSFVAGDRDLGAGHTGLQWHPGAPAGAVNWGGYYASGGGPAGDGTLPGTGSVLPPVDGPHTRHFAWVPGRRYRLRIWSPGPGKWRSDVTDLESGQSTTVRDLLVEADALTSPIVWSEVFARCDDPPTEVRWSHLQALGQDGEVRTARSVGLTYQAFDDGGCSNTETRVDGDCFVQLTGLPLARPDVPSVLSLDG
jgi:hypothetical protein